MTDSSVFGPLFHQLSIDLILEMNKVPLQYLDAYACNLGVYLRGLAYVMPCIHCRQSYRKYLMDNAPERFIEETKQLIKSQNNIRLQHSPLNAFVAYNINGAITKNEDTEEVLQNKLYQISPLLMWWYHKKKYINKKLDTPNLSIKKFLRRLGVWKRFSTPSTPIVLMQLLCVDMMNSLDDTIKEDTLCEYEYRRRAYPSFFTCLSYLINYSQLNFDNNCSHVAHLLSKEWMKLPCTNKFVQSCNTTLNSIDDIRNIIKQICHFCLHQLNE